MYRPVLHLVIWPAMRHAGQRFGLLCGTARDLRENIEKQANSLIRTMML
jgi:hypothetical protein